MGDPAKIMPPPLWKWVDPTYTGNWAFPPGTYQYESTDLNSVEYKQVSYTWYGGFGTPVVPDGHILVDLHYEIEAYSLYGGFFGRYFDYSDVLKWQYGPMDVDVVFSTYSTRNTDYVFPVPGAYHLWGEHNESPMDLWVVPFDMVSYLKNNNYRISRYQSTRMGTDTFPVPPMSSMTVRWGLYAYIEPSSHLQFKPPRFRYWISPGGVTSDLFVNFPNIADYPFKRVGIPQQPLYIHLPDGTWKRYDGTGDLPLYIKLKDGSWKLVTRAP